MTAIAPRVVAMPTRHEEAAEEASGSGSGESDLIRDAALGSQSAFEALYRRHHRRVFGVIWRLVGGVEARAEELTQDAFVRAWQALPGFRGDSAFSTWLHRLAVNTALMNLRSRARGEAAATSSSSRGASPSRPAPSRRTTPAGSWSRG